MPVEPPRSWIFIRTRSIRLSLGAREGSLALEGDGLMYFERPTGQAIHTEV